MSENELLHRVQLTGAPETLLITLYAKALDYRSARSILHDARADQIARAIGYDFSRLDSSGSRTVIPLRAKQFDEWLNSFLQANPNAVVLNLGCGLDTRVTRIAPAPGVRWFDIDYPEVIAARESFYSAHAGYEMRGRSLLDPDLFAGIPGDQPAVIVAEGVFEYLVEADVRMLLERLTGHFASGQLLFDVMSSFAIESGKSALDATTGATHRWAVDDVRHVDELSPMLRRTANRSVFAVRSRWELPWKQRVLYALMASAPRFRNMMRLLRYEFGPSA